MEDSRGYFLDHLCLNLCWEWHWPIQGGGWGSGGSPALGLEFNFSHFTAGKEQAGGFPEPTSPLYCLEPMPCPLYISPRIYRMLVSSWSFYTWRNLSFKWGRILGSTALVTIEMRTETFHQKEKCSLAWSKGGHSGPVTLCTRYHFLCHISVSHRSLPVVFLFMALDPLIPSLPLQLLHSYLCRNGGVSAGSWVQENCWGRY